jgi:hypothetical protein
MVASRKEAVDFRDIALSRADFCLRSNSFAGSVRNAFGVCSVTVLAATTLSR